MITYRPATQSDAPAVLSLLAEIMRHHGVTPPSASRLASVVASILEAPVPAAGDRVAPAHSILVAEDRGRVVGMCALIFSLSTWSAAPVCEVQDLVVTESHRRGDVGRGLLAAAQHLARDRGCARLFLLAESWNLDAHAFYRSLGLVEKTCLYFERDLRDTPATPI
jgi:GNAT superfamily N-acetyltransferase